MTNLEGADPQAERRRAQAHAFDEIGPRYDEAFPHKEGQTAATDWLIAQLKPGAHILDVGCGTGLPTAGRLHGAGFEVTGIDISEKMLALARQNVSGIELRRQDLMDLDPSDGPYDAVVAFFSLLMLKRSDIGPAVDRLFGLLPQGGLLALSMVEVDLDDVPIPFLGSEIRVSGWLRDDLRAVLVNAGFSVENLVGHEFLPSDPEAPSEVQIFAYCRK